MTASSTLHKLRAKLNSPESWTQCAGSRDESGEALALATDYRAVSWCLLAALDCVRTSGGTIQDDDAYRHLHAASKCSGGVVMFNDAKSRTHADILRTIDEAIASAEAEENR